MPIVILLLVAILLVLTGAWVLILPLALIVGAWLVAGTILTVAVAPLYGAGCAIRVAALWLWARRDLARRRLWIAIGRPSRPVL